MNKINKNYVLTRKYIAESLVENMGELAALGLDNKDGIGKIKKQIDTLRLLIAEIYPEEYEHYLYENYAFGFPDYGLI